MGENCAYDTGIRDTETGRVLRATEAEDHPPPQIAPEDQNFNVQEKPSAENQISLAPDYLSLQRGARVRHIGRTFWGFVNGQVSQP